MSKRNEPAILIHNFLIGHPDFPGVPDGFLSFSFKEPDDFVSMDEAFLLHWIQVNHDRLCAPTPAPTCFWEAAEVYQADLPRSIGPDGRFRGVPRFGGRVTTPIPKGVYHKQALCFAVSPKHLANKRARVNSEPSPPPQTIDTARRSKKSRKVILTRIGVERFLTVADKRSYETFPVFRCGNAAVPVSSCEPPSDFLKHLQTDGLLFADFSSILPQLTGDTNGYFTGPLSRSSAKSYASMVKYFRDKAHKDDFGQTFGQLTVGPYAAEHPSEHSRDYILSFDFAVVPKGIHTLESILKRLTDIIDKGVGAAAHKYGGDLSIVSPNAFFGKKKVVSLLILQLEQDHFQRHFEDSSCAISIFIEDYDSMTRYAEFISLTSSPSKPSYPSVDEIIILLETNFYNVISSFRESFGARVYFFGSSPALGYRLKGFLITDVTKLAEGFGVAGYSRAQFQACVAALRGELEEDGKPPLRMALKHLPRYRYGPKETDQFPQLYAHTLLQQFHPRLSPSATKILEACHEHVNRLIDFDALPAIRAIYARRGKQWEASLTQLTVQGILAGSGTHALRHSYGDLPPDETMENGYKLVQCPATPQPFYALCYDEGILTGDYSNNVDVSEKYAFVSDTMKMAFLQKVVQAVKMTGVSVLEPFDGTAEWWYNALAWYLKATRTAVSNYFFDEGHLQCLSLSLCQASLAIGAGSTTRATLETETKFCRRIDILFVEEDLTIVTEDKTISLCNIIEGTFGFTFPRRNHKVNFKELETEHKEMIMAFSEYCRNELPEAVFKETPFTKDYPKTPSVKNRDLKMNPPTKLEDFFYVGWNAAKKWGVYSIFALWEEAELQGNGYATEIQAGTVKDNRFKCRYVGEDSAGPRGMIVVLLVIVVAGLCVLSRESRQRFPSRYILEPTGKLPK
ncbi:hypothetical protein BDZ89DRAFT_1139229 [Hymenopellis radicata]|nr:hypothetical protein BDZ89DRAFT_1139229 [Hymenopellis radicata]